MKKIYLTIGIFILVATFNVSSQQTWGNPIGHYPYNPSAAAMHDVGEILTNYHKKFIDASNSPTGILIMGSSPFSNNNMGAGFKFNSISAGILKELSAEATYVYKAQISRNSKLAFGLSATYNQIGIQA